MTTQSIPAFTREIDALVINLLNTTKKDLRRLKKEDPEIFAQNCDILRAHQLEAKRIISLVHLAFNRINSI